MGAGEVWQVRRPLLFRAGDVWWPRVHEAGVILGCRRQARPRLGGRCRGITGSARGGGVVQAEKALFGGARRRVEGFQVSSGAGGALSGSGDAMGACEACRDEYRPDLYQRFDTSQTAHLRRLACPSDLD
jgi:hypothetical protein